MKVSMPKEISELSTRIAAARSEVDVTRQGISRAEQAIQQADGITAEIEAVSRKRAEQKALAFVSGKPADLAELDGQMADLERANRNALEDGVAAAMALEMLTEKLAQQEQALAALTEERHTRALEWLSGCREKAVDRYIKALNDLGPVLAEAVAADRACVDLGFRGESPAEHLLKALRHKDALPVPWHRRVEREGVPLGITLLDAPITWLRDTTLGDCELEQFVAELLSVGALPK